MASFRSLSDTFTFLIRLKHRAQVIAKADQPMPVGALKQLARHASATRNLEPYEQPYFFAWWDDSQMGRVERLSVNNTLARTGNDRDDLAPATHSPQKLALPSAGCDGAGSSARILPCSSNGTGKTTVEDLDRYIRGIDSLSNAENDYVLARFPKQLLADFPDILSSIGFQFQDEEASATLLPKVDSPTSAMMAARDVQVDIQGGTKLTLNEFCNLFSTRRQRQSTDVNPCRSITWDSGLGLTEDNGSMSGTGSSDVWSESATGFQSQSTVHEHSQSFVMVQDCIDAGGDLTGLGDITSRVTEEPELICANHGPRSIPSPREPFRRDVPIRPGRSGPHDRADIDSHDIGDHKPEELYSRKALSSLNKGKELYTNGPKVEALARAQEPSDPEDSGSESETSGSDEEDPGDIWYGISEIGESNPYRDTIREVVTLILSEFFTCTHSTTKNGGVRENDDGGSSSRPNNSQTATGQSMSRSLNHGSSGRNKNDGRGQNQRKRENEEDDEDQKDGDRSKRVCTTKDENKKGPPFACPFYKNDPHAHQACFKYTLRRIKDVKLHLERVHKPPYCSRCKQTFKTANECHEHSESQPPCQPRATFEAKGVMTCEQHDMLKGKRASRAMNHEEQWHHIYQVLFPGATPPQSVYLEAKLLFLIEDWYDYLNREWLPNLTGRLRERNIVPPASTTSEEDREALDQVLLDGANQIRERFQSESSTSDMAARENTEATAALTPRPVSHSEVPSSPTDSHLSQRHQSPLSQRSHSHASPQSYRQPFPQPQMQSNGQGSSQIVYPVGMYSRGGLDGNALHPSMNVSPDPIDMSHAHFVGSMPLGPGHTGWQNGTFPSFNPSEQLHMPNSFDHRSNMGYSDTMLFNTAMSSSVYLPEQEHVAQQGGLYQPNGASERASSAGHPSPPHNQPQ